MHAKNELPQIILNETNLNTSFTNQVDVLEDKDNSILIEDLINNVSDQDFAKAGVTFADIMNNKIQDSLEQEKVAVARAVYDEDESEEDAEYIDDGEEDPDDEDIEAGRIIRFSEHTKWHKFHKYQKYLGLHLQLDSRKSLRPSNLLRKHNRLLKLM